MRPPCVLRRGRPSPLASRLSSSPPENASGLRLRPPPGRRHRRRHRHPAVPAGPAGRRARRRRPRHRLRRHRLRVPRAGAAAAIVVVLLGAHRPTPRRRAGPAALEVRPGPTCSAPHGRPRRCSARRLAGGPRQLDRARRDRGAAARPSASPPPATCCRARRTRLDPEAAARSRSTPRARACSPPGCRVLFPPLAVLVIAGLLALLLGGRRRAGEKYAGLRILR